MWRFFDFWDNLWWKYTDNGIYGFGYSSHRTFKTSNLALIISIITLITLFLYTIFHG